MQYRVFASIGLAASALTFISLVEAPLGAQAQGTSKPWSAPSTPDGRPDIDGVWSFAINVPFQRPAPGEKGGLTDQEQAELEFRASTGRGAQARNRGRPRARVQRFLVRLGHAVRRPPSELDRRRSAGRSHARVDR